MALSVNGFSLSVVSYDNGGAEQNPLEIYGAGVGGVVYNIVTLNLGLAVDGSEASFTDIELDHPNFNDPVEVADFNSTTGSATIELYLSDGIDLNDLTLSLTATKTYDSSPYSVDLVYNVASISFGTGLAVTLAFSETSIT